MIKYFRLRPSISPVVQQRLAWLFLVVIVLVYVAWMGDQVILRYDIFKATAFDLGNMDQAVWNTLHGRFFQFTNHGSNWYGEPIRLAQHVEPILIPLSLLYLFHADPRILLVFQTLALASGALPVFLLTRRILPSWPLLAPALVLAYLYSPAVIGVNLFDFHPDCLATPFLLYALLALTYGRYAWCVLACFLTMMCKEDMPLVVAMLGVLVAWKYKLPRLGALLFVAGLFWFVITFKVIIPHFNAGAQNNFWYRYAVLGKTPGEALRNVLLHPWLLITSYVTLDRVYYLASLLRSSGFLALLAPEWLLPALPILAINLLSGENFQYSGVYHYNAAIVPFVIIAALHGTRRLILLWSAWRGEIGADAAMQMDIPVADAHVQRQVRSGRFPVGAPIALWGQRVTTRLLSAPVAFARPVAAHPLIAQRIQPRLRTLTQRLAVHRRLFDVRMGALAQILPAGALQWLCVVWVVALLALNYFIMIPQFNIFWAYHRPGAREQQIERLLALIPPGASVSASGNINPHLSEREYVTVFPELTVSTLERSNVPVDYVVVDLSNVSPENKDHSASFLSKLNQIQREKQFRTVARAEGVILLVRNNP